MNGRNSEAWQTIVNCDADLLDGPMTTVVPEQPAFTVENDRGLVHGIVVPAVWRGADDWIGRMTFPVFDAVTRTGNANLRMVHVAKANVEHVVPVAVLHHLAGSHLVALPWAGRVGGEDRISRSLGPGVSVGTGGVA